MQGFMMQVPRTVGCDRTEPLRTSRRNGPPPGTATRCSPPPPLTGRWKARSHGPLPAPRSACAHTDTCAPPSCVLSLGGGARAHVSITRTPPTQPPRGELSATTQAPGLPSLPGVRERPHQPRQRDDGQPPHGQASPPPPCPAGTAGPGVLNPQRIRPRRDSSLCRTRQANDDSPGASLPPCGACPVARVIPASPRPGDTRYLSPSRSR